MKPKTRTGLRKLDGWMRKSNTRLRGMARELRSAGKNLPADFAEIQAAIAHCQASIQELSARIDAAYEADPTLPACWWDESLTEAEIQQLLSLNRQLRDIGPFLRSIAEDVRPRLKGKLADPNDPMYDYEIDALIEFFLREDDPEYDEGDDNVLSTRDESLKHPRYQGDDELADYSEPIGPEGLRAEPHCWRFHDLYDHDYGEESPSLSLRDCLRIGKILIDVQVWQQYSFADFETGDNATGGEISQANSHS